MYYESCESHDVTDIRLLGNLYIIWLYKWSNSSNYFVIKVNKETGMNSKRVGNSIMELIRNQQQP